MKLQEHKIQAGGRAVRVLLLSALLAIGLAHSANAGTMTYTYQGNPLTTGVGTITGSFTLSIPLPDNYNSPTPIDFTPLAYSFTDGKGTITQANAVGGSYMLPGQVLPYSGGVFQVYSTNASGNITGWDIELLTGNGTAFQLLGTATNSPYCCPVGGPSDGSNYAVLVSPGVLAYTDVNYNTYSPGSWTSISNHGHRTIDPPGGRHGLRLTGSWEKGLAPQADRIGPPSTRLGGR